VSKLVLVLFLIVLLATLAVGGFYLFQTGTFSFGYSSEETAVQKAGKNCKNTGFSSTKDADSYLNYFIKKIGADNINNGVYLQVISLGNNCWGVWLGNKSGNGKLYWEDESGKVFQTKVSGVTP
jgi:uncharacterized protein (UPF0333 family)